MLFPVRSNKGGRIYSKQKPADVCRQVLAARDEQFVVRATSICDRCGKGARSEEGSCWACANPADRAHHSFSVKLADSGVKAHGIFSGFLSIWNPGQLTCVVTDYGYGSQIEVTVSGTLSIAETLIAVVSCALLCWTTASTFPIDLFHVAVALMFFPLGPLFYLEHRRQQERELLAFVSKRLPETLVDGLSETD